MRYIRELKYIGMGDVEIAGGKGASLGELIKSKIPVPNGFVILSNSFEKFLKETGIDVEIDSALDSINPQDVNSINKSSETIQSKIISKKIPGEIIEDIMNAYSNLKTEFVAIRSSATSEDSADATWAGQLDTYLNTKEEHLIKNIKKCWASLFNPRALSYRFGKKLNKQKISVAIVIQEMINSEESGVSFSVHPITKDKNQIIIEASFGLGEAIVSGRVTPDSYVLDKYNWHIIDINVNEKLEGLFKGSNGNNKWVKLLDKSRQQVLSNSDIIRLGKLIKKIEDHYQFPVDVEWAKENNKFYILQSRPITTLID